MYRTGHDWFSTAREALADWVGHDDFVILSERPYNEDRAYMLETSRGTRYELCVWRRPA